MKEVVDKVSKRWIQIEVTEPVTITTKYHLGWTSSYTSYLIRLETNHWAFSLGNSEVRRRFSDFCWLRSKLREHHPTKTVPPLPPKHFLHITNFDPQIIQDRFNGLEKFLQRVLRSFVFLSDAALHLFLQSDLTINQIEMKLHEEIKPKVNYTKRLVQTLTEKIAIQDNNVEFNGSCSSGSITSGDLDDDDDCDQAEFSSGGGGLSDSEEKELDHKGIAQGFNIIPAYDKTKSRQLPPLRKITDLRKLVIGKEYDDLSK